MEHPEAVAGDFCERYLRGELSEAEREEFELHFLQCPACVEEMESTAAFTAGLRAAFRERARGRGCLGRLILRWWRGLARLRRKR